MGDTESVPQNLCTAKCKYQALVYLLVTDVLHRDVKVNHT
jgi:hypothetical protein